MLQYCSQPGCYNEGNSLLKLLLMQITLEVPDLLGEKLQQLGGGMHPLGNRLPEALDRALWELTIELLASQPSPEAILAIRPTPALQIRMSQLLDRNKSGTLSRLEEVEFAWKEGGLFR